MSKYMKHPKRYARKLSKRLDDFTAVTKDNTVITTLPCVRYQLDQNNLKRIYYQGLRMYPKSFAT